MTTINVRDVPYVFDLLEQPVRSLLNADIQIEHRIDQYSIMTLTNPAKDYDNTVTRQPPFHIDYQIIYRGERYLMTNVRTSGSRDELEVTAEVPYLKLDDMYGWYEFKDMPLRSAIDQVLEGTQWTVDHVEDPYVVINILAEDEKKLHLLRLFAETAGARIVFDTINYRVSFENPDAFIREFVAQESVNIQDIEREVQDVQATELYPIGIDDIRISSVNGGKDFISNYNYYTNKGWSLEEAKKRFRRVVYRKYDNIGWEQELLEAARRDLPAMSRPTVGYKVDLSLIPEDVRVGDYFFVIDSMLSNNKSGQPLAPDVDGKARVQVVRMVEFKDRSLNTVELNHIPESLNQTSLGSGNNFSSGGGYGTGGPGTGPYGGGSGGGGGGKFETGLNNGLELTGDTLRPNDPGDWDTGMYLRNYYRPLGGFAPDVARNIAIFTPSSDSLAFVEASFFIEMDRAYTKAEILEKISVCALLRLNTSQENVKGIAQDLATQVITIGDPENGTYTKGPIPVTMSTTFSVAAGKIYGISAWVKCTGRVTDGFLGGVPKVVLSPSYGSDMRDPNYGTTRMSRFRTFVMTNCNSGQESDLPADTTPIPWVSYNAGVAEPYTPTDGSQPPN